MTDPELEAAIETLEAMRARHKAAEKAYPVRGDVVWFTESGPVQVWEHAGILCAVGPNQVFPGFHGYVQLPDGHPWRSLELQHGEGQPDVHGGITFGPHLTGWIGFDTGHAGDRWSDEEIERYLAELPEGHLSQATLDRWKASRTWVENDLLRMPDEFDHPWTIKALKAEIERLAEQVVFVAQMAPQEQEQSGTME